MRGLPEIAKARRSGFKPSPIWLTPKAHWGSQEVVYEPGDVPELVDLRPLVGCLVMVDGKDQETVERWCAAVLAAGARSVAGTVFDKFCRIAWTKNYRVEGVDL